MKWNLWNPRWTSLLLVVVAGTLVGTAQAAEPRAQEPGRLPRPLAALDTDQDGTLSETEMERASKSLKELDRNGDGRIAADEIRRGREARRASDAAEGDRPLMRRQSRPEPGASNERADQGGRRLRHREDGNAVGRERRPDRPGDGVQAAPSPARERRREGLRRQDDGDRTGPGMRRDEGGPGPKRGARFDREPKRVERPGGHPTLSRRQDDRRGGSGERCPECGRPLPAGHRESGTTGRRGPGGRG